jgi:allene oxide cyclase
MPRRVLVSLLAALLSAGAVAGVALARGSGASSHILTIRAIELPVQSTFTDLHEKGLTQGDTFAAANVLRTLDRSAVIGRQDVWCTVLNAKRARFECDITAFLHGGSVMAQGPFQIGKGGRLAIVGGTGQYREARGQLVAIDLGNEISRLTYQIVLH